ncbi:hypothetical protein PG993_011968 [Apiospora rasikravindrae]|uniref:Uncharacterized protein n=1 Tax=Apiospora rasikravindrae TaxID=990691 RepID=A0ABR1S2G5_9PEZI
MRLPRHRLERLAELQDVHLGRLEHDRVPDPPGREIEERAGQVHRPGLEERPTEVVVLPRQAREFGGEFVPLPGCIGDARGVGRASVGLNGPHRILRHEGRGLGPDRRLETVEMGLIGEIPRTHSLTPLGQQFQERGGGVRDDLVG